MWETPSVRLSLGGVTASFGRGGSPTRPPCAASNRGDGSRLNTGGGGGGTLSRLVESGAGAAERLPNNVGVVVGVAEPELEKVSLRTIDVFPMSCGRESTAVDGFRSTVMMVAEVTLSLSSSDSEALRYIPI